MSTVGNLSDKYDLSITPAGFTFTIWSIIYIWLAAAIGFCKFYFHIFLQKYHAPLSTTTVNQMDRASNQKLQFEGPVQIATKNML